MDIYPAAAELIRDVPVEQPVFDIRPRAVACVAWRLGDHFPREMLCAVRANGSPAGSRILAHARTLENLA